MAKARNRTYSRYTRQAVTLLGMMVREARIDRKITTEELAARAGISRGLLYRIENGDPRCELGAAFEVASLVGVSLFDAELAELQDRSAGVAKRLTLLPRNVRKPSAEVKDDF